jgi:hypothetical protein
MQLATKLAFSSSRKLYKMLETFVLVLGDGWYRIFERKSFVFFFKDLLLQKAYWSMSMVYYIETK